MPIRFACPACEKPYTLANSFAGRSGTCKACGQTMTVADSSDEISRVYGLSEPVVPPGRAPEVATFAASRAAPGPPRPRRSAQVGRPQGGRPALAVGVGVGVGVALVLALVSAAAPAARPIVGLVLLCVGSLMVLIGYGVGAWAAFREDTLYGFLYVVIPLYTAYYWVTRFADLWPWLALMTLGVALVGVGGRLVEPAVLPPVQEIALVSREISPRQGEAPAGGLGAVNRRGPGRRPGG